MAMETMILQNALQQKPAPSTGNCGGPFSELAFTSVHPDGKKGIITVDTEF